MNNLPEVVTWKSQLSESQVQRPNHYATRPCTTTLQPVNINLKTLSRGDTNHYSNTVFQSTVNFWLAATFSNSAVLFNCSLPVPSMVFSILLPLFNQKRFSFWTLTYERFILHSFQKITTWVKWYRILLVFAFPTNFQLVKGAKALSIGTDHQPKKNHPLAGNIFSWFYDSRGKECCSLQACVDPRISTWHCSHLLLNTVLLGAHHPPLSTDISSRRANSSKVCGPCWDRQMDGRTTYRFIDVAPHSMSAVSSCQHMSLCKH